MSGINLIKIFHGDAIKVIDAKSSDYNTTSSLTQINCNGFNRLMVHYQLSSTSWDRAGNIIIYGSLWSDTADANSLYVPLDDTVENATFSVTSTDDAKVNSGEMYFVENIPPYIKVGWDNTTAGTTGTITVWVLPCNY